MRRRITNTGPEVTDREGVCEDPQDYIWAEGVSLPMDAWDRGTVFVCVALEALYEVSK